MSEFDEAEQEPDFDDPTYADLRAQLADLRETAPMPADVAASLDATLAGLVAERSQTADVVPLRRRLRPTRVLAAAAAVVLLGAGGVGLQQVLKGSDSSTSLSTADRSVAASAPASPPPPAPAAPQVASEDAGGLSLGAGTGGTTGGSGSATGDGSGPWFDVYLADSHFTRAHFSSQTVRFLRSADAVGRTTYGATDTSPGSAAEAPALPAPASPQTGKSTDNLAGKDQDLKDLSTALEDSRPTAACPGPEVNDGSTLVLVTYERTRAVLVVHPKVDGSRFVAVWSCNGARLLDFATIKA